MANSLYKSTIGMITRKGADATDDGEWIISGKYTDDKIDLHGHIIDREAMISALPTYKEWNTLREMHELPIGTVKTIGEPEWNDIEAVIAKSSRGQDAWEMVKAGVYKAFSVGILVTDGYFLPVKELDDSAFDNIDESMRRLIEEIEYVFKITGLVLVENSIVDRPANPAARAKALQEAGMDQVKGYLPEIQSAKGIDIIKSVFPGSRKFFVGDAPMTEGLYKVENGVVSYITESDMDSEKEINSASTQPIDSKEESNVDKQEKDVTEQPEAQLDEAVVEDQEQPQEADKVADDVQADDVAQSETSLDQQFMDDTRKSLTDINTGIEKLVDMFGKFLESVNKAVEEGEVDEHVETDVDIEVDETDKGIDVDELAEKVYEKLASKIGQRKGVVTNDTEQEDTPEGESAEDDGGEMIPLNSIDTKSLRVAIGKIAAKIASEK